MWHPRVLLVPVISAILAARGPSTPSGALAADCNLNGVDDAVDIAGGVSADCNANEFPDECELLSGLRFAGSPDFAVGEFPHELEAADFDGDGDRDLVASDRAADTLSFLLNDGRGDFAPAVALAVGDEPRGIDSGDVDGDGDLDIVCGNGNEDSAGDLPTNSVLLNGGGGSFAPAVSYLANPAQAGALRSVWLVDLDGDGDLDIANGFSEGRPGGVITLLFNDGAGVFSAPTLITNDVPGFEDLQPAKYMALGPVDGDDRPDIVTFSGQVLFNLGGGSFASPRSFATIEGAMNVTLADLDGDGDLDVALLRAVVVGLGSAGEVALFFNDGGSLVARSEPVLLTDQIQEGIAAADFDGDGDLDLAVSYRSSQADIAVNDGGGSFHLVDVPFPLGGGVPRWVLAAEINGDGKADLAFPKSNHSVSVLFNLNSRDDNSNGVPDECDVAFLRGDPNDDGAVNVTDAIYLLRHLFQGGKPPGCQESADADDDGSLSITDAVSLLDFLFRGGSPPGSPGPPPGICSDALGSPPFLGCAAYSHCP